MSGPKLGIVSTTINNEEGYLPFDRQAADCGFSEVFFCIAADLKSPAFDSSQFCCPVIYLTPKDQEQFSCSSEIGWNKIMRRNTALLRCIAEQPDYILMIDDDNHPLDDYFGRWLSVLNTVPDSQVIARAPHEGVNGPVWHNYLRSADSGVEIYPRGFPVDQRGRHHTKVVSFPESSAGEGDVLLYQGISLGDPDIDAMTRIAVSPFLSRVEEYNYLLKNVWSPYNTQNTLFTRSLFPLAFVWPFCGRFDDIFASFSWQQFIFCNDKFVHVGEPFNEQQVRPRDLLADLEAETEGIQQCQAVHQALSSVSAATAPGFIEKMLDLKGPEILSRQFRFMEAFRRDLEDVLS